MGAPQAEIKAIVPTTSLNGDPDTIKTQRDQASDKGLVQKIQFAPGRVLPMPLPPIAIPGTVENENFVKSVEDLGKSAAQRLEDALKAIDRALHAQKADKPLKPDPKISPSDQATTPTGPEDPNDTESPTVQSDSFELTRPQRGAVTKVDNIISNGAKEHDFEGVVRELEGESTGFDHVTEMKNNVRGLRDALGSIRGSLANPNLTPAARSQLEAALERGQNVLDRMQNALAGKR